MPDTEQQLQAAAKDKEPADKGTKEKEDIDPSDKLTPEHPRFKEVYAKSKESERRIEKLEKSLEEKDMDIHLMRQHNQELSESITTMTSRIDSKEETPPPDPNEDPEGYHKWWQEKRTKEKEDEKKERYLTRTNDQIDVQKDLHSDYESVVKPVMKAMETDGELRKKIFGSYNPAREAYKYGKDKMDTKDKEGKEKEEKEAERQRAIDQGHVEGGTQGKKSEPSGELSAEEKRTAALMGVSEKKYLEQREIMKSRG
jgi:uncharacterized coiled-coil protein SlyX